MAVPDVIHILYEPGYRTDTIGRYADGQFFGCVTGADREPYRHRPDDWEKHQRWYAVLHLFEQAGNHVASDIWFAGTTASGWQEAIRRAEEHLASRLDELSGRVYGDIAVRLFSVEFDGVVFGLVDESDPDRGDWVELYPDGLGFHEPWNGEYDT